MTNKAFIEIS